RLFPGAGPSFFSARGGGKDMVRGLDTSDFPVDSVGWDDARVFCDKLSGLTQEQRAGRCYRLPTSAEREDAARAGNSAAYCFGDDPAQLDKYAWFKLNSGGRTWPVRSREPNAWGLYDMHGLVREWCADKVGTGGVERLLRGGSWKQDAEQ